MAVVNHHPVDVVAPPSIRLWILKDLGAENRLGMAQGCTPFDPLVDTESHDRLCFGLFNFLLHPLRSACGY